MKKIFFLAFISLTTWLNCQSLPQKTTAQTNLQILGKRLFSEVRLSRNGTKSCASCHSPDIAFTDGYRQSLGIEADAHPFNAPTLLNSRYLKTLSWTNSHIVSFQQQMQQPLFGENPLEMGLKYSDTTRLAAELSVVYKQKLTWQTIEKAIVAYLQTLVTDVAKKKKLTSAQQRGQTIFNDLGCQTCHQPPFYTLATETTDAFFAHRSSEQKYRVPSLLNVALTAPYFHDGSIETLSEAIDSALVFQPLSKPNTHFYNSPKKISAMQKHDLIAFLHGLTDTVIVKK